SAVATMFIWIMTEAIPIIAHTEPTRFLNARIGSKSRLPKEIATAKTWMASIAKISTMGRACGASIFIFSASLGTYAFLLFISAIAAGRRRFVLSVGLVTSVG